MPKPKPEKKMRADKQVPESGGGDQLRKKDLIDRVAASSGSKPGDVKKVVEAALAFIAERLGQEETLNLPPLGKLTLAKRKDTPKGEVLTLKLRRAGAEKTVKGPLAAQGE